MMRSVKSDQLVDEIVDEDEVVLLYKEHSGLRRVPLRGVPAGDIDGGFVETLVEIVEVAHERPGERLSAGELEVLERYPAASREEVGRSLARTAGMRQTIIDAALSAAEAAARLGVGPSRIRQRIGGGTLYGIKDRRGSWRLPQWQFTSRGEVPGIAAVIRSLPEEIDLLEVDGFLTRPNVDLVVDDVTVTPLEWLGGGLDPEPVAQIAIDL